MTEIVTPPVIQVTINLDRFHLLPENRDVNPRLVSKMVASITEGKNFLPFYPIIVGTDNSVRDGQHRLEAARRCEVPIYFIVSDIIEVKDIATLNSATMKWSLLDYLNYWTSVGYQPYALLTELMDEYPRLRVTAGMAVASSDETRGSRYTHFKEGTWGYANDGTPEMVAQVATSIDGLWVDAWRRSSILALMHMVKHDRFDQQRFVDKVKENNGLLSRHPRWEDVLKVYQMVYNYRARGRSRVNFFPNKFFLSI